MSLHSESTDWKIYEERACADMMKFVKKTGAAGFAAAVSDGNLLRLLWESD